MPQPTGAPDRETSSASPVSREVHCADALDWLAARPQTAASFVTSLPDVCEVPLAFAAWRAWFIDAAAAVMLATPADGVAIFYQQPTNQLTVAAYYGVAAPLTMSWTVPASTRLHRITVTSVPTGLSAEPSFGVAQTVTTGSDVLPSGGDVIRLPNAVGTRIDELEIWGEDLDALSPEAACENRLDGEWDPATDTCALTSN